MRLGLRMNKRRFRVRVMFLELNFIAIMLFVLGLLGIIFNRTNLILVLMSIEIILLAVSINLLIFSFLLNSVLGQIFSIFILTVAAAESAIGLSIMVAFYKIKGSISIRSLNLLKG
jgi:NADH:ubiquinone oxidoreductase subunit K